MHELFHIDWSFIVVLGLLVFMTVALVVRAAIARRKDHRATRRAARRAHRHWLRDSRRQSLDAPEHEHSERS